MQVFQTGVVLVRVILLMIILALNSNSCMYCLEKFLILCEIILPFIDIFTQLCSFSDLPERGCWSKGQWTGFVYSEFSYYFLFILHSCARSDFSEEIERQGHVCSTLINPTYSSIHQFIYMYTEFSQFSIFI